MCEAIKAWSARPSVSRTWAIAATRDGHAFVAPSKVLRALERYGVKPEEAFDPPDQIVLRREREHDVLAVLERLLHAEALKQRPAHERIIFDTSKSRLENEIPVSQQILFPIHLELSLSELEAFRSSRDVFEKLGFHLEPFGGKRPRGREVLHHGLQMADNVTAYLARQDKGKDVPAWLTWITAYLT